MGWCGRGRMEDWSEETNSENTLYMQTNYIKSYCVLNMENLYAVSFQYISIIIIHCIHCFHRDLFSY